MNNYNTHSRCKFRKKKRTHANVLTYFFEKRQKKLGFFVIFRLFLCISVVHLTFLS